MGGLDDISEYYHVHVHAVYKINVFLYYHAVNFCVGLPLKRNTVGPMCVVFIHASLVCTDRKRMVGGCQLCPGRC